MKRASLPSLVIPILLLILFAPPLPGQGVSLPVSPVFEGLDVHPETGVYYARFGYHNENDRVIEIPAGEDNGFGPGTEDLGQVTVFQPGRHENAFQVELDKLLPREWNLRGPDGQSRQAEAPPIKGVTKLKPIIGNRGIIDEYDPEMEALNDSFEDSFSNGAQPKFFMRLIPEVAVGNQNDDSPARIDPMLAEGEDRIMEVVQLWPQAVPGSGSVKYQADYTRTSDQTRGGLGFNCEGVRLGILTHSYHALGEAAEGLAKRELPNNVLVLKDISGSDEGRALADAECEILVDDVTHPTAPWFKDGSIYFGSSNIFQADPGIYFLN